MLTEAQRTELRELLPYLTKPEQDEIYRLLWQQATGTPPPDYLSWLRGAIPRAWTVDAPHIRLIAEHLDAVTLGQIDRLAIHMPPRHAKTETITVRYPLHRLEMAPGMNTLTTGFNERFARKLGRKTRNLAAERNLVATDKSASDEWATPQGGLFMARGVGSPPTGTGFHLILIDDPIRRRQDAESEAFREATWDWYTDDLYTRLEPGGAIVLVMTLWNEDDVGYRAVASEPNRWTVLKLPALAEDNDPLGRLPGAALWPERYTEKDLARIRKVQAKKDGERSWLALYQQRPTPKEGSFFKVGNFGYIDANELPAGLRVVRRWDLAATEGDGAFTAGVKMATGIGERHPAYGKYFILDATRGQWATDRRDREIRDTATADGKSVRIGGPQDPGAAGVQAAAAFVRNLTGYTVRTDVVSGSKETRADPYSSQVNAGNVFLVRGAWNKEFVEEHRGFPDGKYKDQVDAAADAFNDLNAEPPPPKTVPIKPMMSGFSRR